MKLSPEELQHYYESQGIRASDLLSGETLTLAELPEGITLIDADRREVQGIVDLWNRLDVLSKLDAAYAAERRVLKKRPVDCAESWAASLMLGRIRGCEARRDVMQRIARGEVVKPPPRARQPKAGKAATTPNVKPPRG